MERLAGGVMLLWGAKRAAFAFLVGAIAALALPPIGFVAAPFFSFNCLVWLIDGATGNPDSGASRGFRAAFLTGWMFGFGYFVAGLWWLGSALLVEADEFAWALPLAILGLPAVLALFYGLATLLARVLWSDGLGRIAALAAGFGLAEWLRGFVATGFPWNAIGQAAMPVPILMQPVHVVGLFGMSALAVFVFAVPALLGTRKGVKAGLALAVLILAVDLGYGGYRLLLAEPGDAPKLTVRLVQPSVDQARKMENSDREAVFADLLALSALPPADGAPRPDLIVWPETSVPFILTENPDAFTRIDEVLKDGQTLMAGAVRAEERGPGLPPRYYNSIYVIDDRGQVVGASDKVHLTPFGEYVPFEDVLRRFGIDNLISLPGGFSAAADRAALPLPNGLKLYPLICYEIIFPQEMADDLADVAGIVNLTNDAWFGSTPGPYQHLLQARIRAVESGLPVIRGANSGVSALIDARGRILAGLPLSKSAVIDATIGLYKRSGWSKTDRSFSFWLIIAGFAAFAVVSRRRFIVSNN